MKPPRRTRSAVLHSRGFPTRARMVFSSTAASLAAVSARVEPLQHLPGTREREQVVPGQYEAMVARYSPGIEQRTEAGGVHQAIELRDDESRALEDGERKPRRAAEGIGEGQHVHGEHGAARSPGNERQGLSLGELAAPQVVYEE